METQESIEKEKEPCAKKCTNMFFNIVLLVLILFIVVTLFFSVFLSTMIFVYSVITTIIYRLVGLFYNFAVVIQQPYENKNVFLLLSNCLWFFYSIPLVALFLSIVMKIVTSFFSDMWGRLNPTHLLEIANSTQGNGKRTSQYWLSFFFISCLSLFAIFVIIILVLNVIPVIKDEPVVRQCTLAVCVVFCSITIFYFFKVIFHAWTCMFRTEPKDRKEQEEELLEISDDNKKADDKNADKTKKGAKNAKEITKSFKSFYDPANLLSEREWIDYMEDARFNSFRYGWRMRHERLFGIFTFILVVVMQAFTVKYAFVPKQDDVQSLLLAGFHVLFYIACLPFLIICNVTSVFLNIKKMAKYPNVRLLMIATLGLFALIFIIIVVFAGVIHKIEFFPLPKLIRVVPVDDYLNYTVKVDPTTFPPICSLNYREIPITTLSALLAASYELPSPYSKQADRNVFANTLDVFRHHNDPPIEGINFTDFMRTVNDDLVFARYDIQINNKTEHIIAIQGITTTLNWAFFIDLFIHSYMPQILDAVIPFFKLADSFFLHSTLLELSYWLQKFFGIDSATKYFADALNDFSPEHLMTGIDIDNNERGMAFLGHTIGGTFTKIYSLLHGYQGFSFESLQVYGSYLESYFQLSNKTCLQNKEKVINFYSQGSLMAQLESKIKVNIELPSVTSPLSPVGPYDTACSFVAACSKYKIQYDFCDDALGPTRFNSWLKYFNRTRTFLAPDQQNRTSTLLESQPQNI